MAAFGLQRERCEWLKLGREADDLRPHSGLMPNVRTSGKSLMLVQLPRPTRTEMPSANSAGTQIRRGSNLRRLERPALSDAPGGSAPDNSASAISIEVSVASRMAIEGWWANVRPESSSLYPTIAHSTASRMEPSARVNLLVSCAKFIEGNAIRIRVVQ